ncbi:hypothetical protein H0H81_001861 [Sphagnurus paluster]|uniref:Uncharacterized protein n=1 Tax=Sphagnurus paluster TaxID=117069 RepID=A0A9P7FTK0_9AGAR|nr:hypothetical protein H0H81_001861 [Sphagnurus paluster]
MDTMNKLKDGKYLIVNRASGDRVGVAAIDPGFTRYAVGRAPKHLEKHELPSVTWTVTNKKDDLFELKVEDGFAIANNDAVFAPPKGGEQLWKVVYREGNKAYTIELEEKNEPMGWVLRGQDMQVGAVKGTA